MYTPQTIAAFFDVSPRFSPNELRHRWKKAQALFEKSLELYESIRQTNEDDDLLPSTKEFRTEYYAYLDTHTSDDTSGRFNFDGLNETEFNDSSSHIRPVDIQISNEGDTFISSCTKDQRDADGSNSILGSDDASCTKVSHGWTGGSNST